MFDDHFLTIFDNYLNGCVLMHPTFPVLLMLVYLLLITIEVAKVKQI